MDKSIIIFKDHAILRMLERGISKIETTTTISKGETIEQFNDDVPYPTCLMLKIINNKPVHVIVAHNYNENQKIIVTVYIPDFNNFESDFKTRKN